MTEEKLQPESDIHPPSQDFEVIEVEFPKDLQLFLFKEMCRRDLRPSEYLREIIESYINAKENS